MCRWKSHGNFAGRCRIIKDIEGRISEELSFGTGNHCSGAEPYFFAVISGLKKMYKNEHKSKNHAVYFRTEKGSPISMR